MTLALSLLLAFAPESLAAKCDSLVAQAQTAKGPELVAAWKDLLKCDSELGQTQFEAFFKNTVEVGTAVDLAIAAIDAKAYNPVWAMIEKVPDYSAREEVSKGIGARCDGDAEVVTFLQGAFYGLRGRQFSPWQPALGTCAAPTLITWMEGIVVDPPKSAYDDKYNVILEAFVAHKKVEALPVLGRAAVASANNGGPFNAVLEQMGKAALGADGKPAAENMAALEGAMTTVASAVPPEQAAAVADRLFALGSERTAASLLPRVYPDRVQAGGKLLYGVAAVESCDKQAVVHFMTALEPARRWSILKDVEPTARAVKARLKCKAEGEWPVVISPQPLKDADAVDPWIATVVEQWSAKGVSVKTKEEKALSLD